MNENLPLKAPVISDWLLMAARQITAVGIATAKLDAEIILAHTLRRNRTYLHAHGEESLTQRQLEIADARLQLRLDRTPVAYIVGHKEFYGRSFRVTPATLIPRPESEMIIEQLKALRPTTTALIKDVDRKRLVDVGTGTGCLGITAKLEMPELDVSLLDISRHALTIAEANANALGADITLIHSDLLTNYPFTVDYIVANLPYVDPTWERSPETNYEPALALFAAHEGLELIFRLIEQAPSHLQTNGILLLEADPRQHAAIVSYAKRHSFTPRAAHDFIVTLAKS